MPRRVFDLPASSRSDDPIVIQIGGTAYRCVDDLPARAVYLLTTDSGTSATIAFIRACLPPDAEATFDEQLADRDAGRIVTQDVLSDVMDYLIGAYAQRPTSPPANLPGGRQATTDSSPPEPGSPG